MSYLNQFLGNLIEVHISGNIGRIGILIDFGLDILVIYDGEHFLYIPLIHIQRIVPNPKCDYEIKEPPEVPININTDSISLRKILINAKGTFAEVYVAGRLSIHGYVTNILNDYFVFYSPVYKTMFISFNHLKWLIPYNRNITPYSLQQQDLPVNPSSISLSRTFEEQVKKFEGKMVVFDLGETPNKIGLLNKMESNMIELVEADGTKVYWNPQHLKSIHLP